MVGVRGFGEQQIAGPVPEVGSAGGVIPGFRDAMRSAFDVSAGYCPVGIGGLNDP